MKELLSFTRNNIQQLLFLFMLIHVPRAPAHGGAFAAEPVRDYIPPSLLGRSEAAQVLSSFVRGANFIHFHKILVTAQGQD